jgi:CheY-like chemotaxis protein
MKALIIADDETIISRISKVLGQCGYDCIVYRWLLKALDNVEEISPHLVVISARDYPRHWKTFVQYISGLESTKATKVILYIDNEFSQDEKKKAQALGIYGIFPSECTDSDFISIIERVQNNTCKQSVTKKADEECLFICTNNITGTYITGSVLSFTNNILQFKADSHKEIEGLKCGDTVSPCTIKCTNHISSAQAIIREIPLEENTNILSLEIKIL